MGYGFKIGGREMIKLDASITASVSSLSLTGTSTTSSFTYNYVSDGVINIVSDNTSVATVSVNTSTKTVTVTYVGSGTANINLNVPETNLYKAAPQKSVPVSCSRSAGSITAPTAKSLTYSGSGQTLVNAGSSTTGTVYYASTANNVTTAPADSSFSTTAPSGTNAGTYRVWYFASQTANYNATSKTYVDVTIGKANGYINTKPTAKTGLSYTGKDQVLINAGGNASGTIQYSVTNSTSGFGTSVPQKTNAGNYTVWYKVLESDNYKAVAVSSVAVNIARIANTISISSTSGTITYPTTTTTFTVTNPTGGSLTVSSNATGVATASISGTTVTITWKSAGNANITVTSAQTTNYNAGSKTYTVTIAKGAGSISKTPSFTAVTYDGAAHYPTDGTATGTIEYYINNVWTTTKPGFVAAQNTTVKCRAAASNYYNQSGEYTFNVTIGRADRTIRSYRGNSYYCHWTWVGKNYLVDMRWYYSGDACTPYITDVTGCMGLSDEGIVLGDVSWDGVYYNVLQNMYAKWYDGTGSATIVFPASGNYNEARYTFYISSGAVPND